MTFTSTFDFDQIPNNEDDFYEFKSSRIASNPDEFQKKLCKSIAGFANSGGGFFIVGIDDNSGEVDGGISRKVGKQPLNDWVDQMLSKIEPTIPKYSVLVIDQIREQRGKLLEGRVILVISVEESFNGPHMAPDHIYYIRAGAHTVPARHFIVEAIRTKRFQSKPSLSHVFRIKPTNDQVLQLGIVAINDAPAINVKINLNPIPKHLESVSKDFPITLAVIDRNHPFYFDVATYFDCTTSFGNDVNLKIQYEDILQNSHIIDRKIGVEGVIPINIGANEIKKSLDAIVSAITKLKA